MLTEFYKALVFMTSLLIGSLIAISPANAGATRYYGFNTSVPDDSGRVFSGSFAVSSAANVYTLKAFNGSYDNHQYDLSNTVLERAGNGIIIGGYNYGAGVLKRGTDDFSLGYFNFGDTQSSYTLSRSLMNGFKFGTLSLIELENITKYNFNTIVSGDKNKIFSGSFSVREFGGAYSLTSFDGSYDGFSYGLSNVVLEAAGDGIIIGGSNSGANAVKRGINDFSLGYLSLDADVAKYTLTRNGYNSFFFGNVELSKVGVVPEPASWMMMLAGFGLIGAAVRRRRITSQSIRRFRGA